MGTDCKVETSMPFTINFDVLHTICEEASALTGDLLILH